MNTRCSNCAENYATKDCTATKKKYTDCNRAYAAQELVCKITQAAKVKV